MREGDKQNLQFLMSEMNTARPRIPSPLETAGMFVLSRVSAARSNFVSKCAAAAGKALRPTGSPAI